MIDSVKIDLLGDIFEIFSLGADEKNPEDLKTNAENICVFLYPSLAADFSVKAYSRVKENYCDYYAAALIAAAFLIMKRGLPLSEIVFETPRGNIAVFCTGRGVLKVKIDNCKLLLSSKRELSGCEMEYNDIFIGEKIRALHTDDPDLFEIEKLRELAVASSGFPSAVILSSSDVDKLRMRSCRDFSEAFVSNLLLLSSAAYNEWVISRRKFGKFLAEENNSAFEVAHSSVTVETIPIIL